MPEVAQIASTAWRQKCIPIHRRRQRHLFVLDHRLPPQIGKIAIGLAPNFFSNILSRTSLRLGASVFHSFFEQTANICMPSAVCFGGVKCPSSTLSRTVRCLSHWAAAQSEYRFDDAFPMTIR